jgi:hypothetical protein
MDIFKGGGNLPLYSTHDLRMEPRHGPFQNVKVIAIDIEREEVRLLGTQEGAEPLDELGYILPCDKCLGQHQSAPCLTRQAKLPTNTADVVWITVQPADTITLKQQQMCVIFDAIAAAYLYSGSRQRILWQPV